MVDSNTRVRRSPVGIANRRKRIRVAFLRQTFDGISDADKYIADEPAFRNVVGWRYGGVGTRKPKLCPALQTRCKRRLRCTHARTLARRLCVGSVGAHTHADY